MYQALKRLKVMGSQGPLVRMPGDLVPEADAWKDTVIRAHLNLELIQVVVEAPEAIEAVAETAVEEAPEEVAVTTLGCDVCGQAFKSASSLKKHTKKHK